MAAKPEDELIAVAMVSWRSRDALRESLPALEALRESFSLELALVDNASGDGSLEEAQRLAPWARLLANPQNAGFARASNQAAAVTRAPWLLFLNPDARIAPGDLRRLLEALVARPQAAAAGPSLFDRRGRLWPSAYADINALNYWTYFSLIAPLWRGWRAWVAGPLRKLGVGRRTRRADWLMGACLLVRRSAFEQAGGFPEAYHLYCEDAELGWRLRQFGWESLYVPEARAVHTQGHSSAQAKAQTRAALFRSLRLYGQRCRGEAWIRSVGRSARLDMRLRLAIVTVLEWIGLCQGALAERRAAFREILEIWAARGGP